MVAESRLREIQTASEVIGDTVPLSNLWDDKMKVKIPKEMEVVTVRHKCGRIWRVTRSAVEKKALWCPDCKDGNFEVVNSELRE